MRMGKVRGVSGTHVKYWSELSDDWRSTMFALFSSPNSQTPNRKGARLLDAAEALNVDVSQLGRVLWFAAYYSAYPITSTRRGLDDPITMPRNSEHYKPPIPVALELQLPSYEREVKSETVRLYPVEDCYGEWSKTDKGGGRPLETYARELWENSDVSVKGLEYDFRQFFCYLNLGNEATKQNRSEDGIQVKQYLYPSSLAKAGRVPVRMAQGTKKTSITSITPYGLVPVQAISGAERNAASIDKALRENKPVRITGGDWPAEVREAWPLRIYPIDLTGFRVAVLWCPDEKLRTIDLYKYESDERLDEHGAQAIYRVEVASAVKAGSQPGGFPGEIDLWDVPPACTYPEADSDDVLTGVELLFTEIKHTDGSQGNVMRKVAELTNRNHYGHPGTVTFFDKNNNETARHDKAWTARYRAETVYGVDGLKRFIRSWGSSCLVASPPSLQAWHIEESFELLERFVPLRQTKGE